MNRATGREVVALRDLVLRLWADDLPASKARSDIDAWASLLPEDERAALNAVLGEGFGGGEP